MQSITSRLATYSTLIGVDQDHLKQFIKNNLRLDQVQGRYNSDSFLMFPSRIKENKQSLKQHGHDISKALSEIKKYQDQRDDRALMVRSIYYINQIKETFRDQVIKSIEPNLLYVRDQFENNNWIKIPFMQYGIESSNLFLAQVLHNVHQSEVDPMMIAYYPTLNHMRLKKEVRTKLGKYLTNFKEYFNLSDLDIKNCVEAHASFIQSRKGWNLKFIESNDPQGWIDVYSKSQYKPRSKESMSCMTDCTSVKVYAHDKSVLRLAYLTDNETIIGRAIVREDSEKGYVRIYPDPNGFPEGRFLLDSLKAQGYEDQTNLNGILLDCIEQKSKYLAPYIDRGNDDDPTDQSGSFYHVDGKNYIKIGYGDEFQLDSTDGFANETDLHECDDCGDRVHEDDIAYSEYHDRHLCDDCRSNDYYYAYVSPRYEDYVHADYVTEFKGDFYVTDNLHEFDIYLCEQSGEYYESGELLTTSRGMIHESYCVEIDHEDSEGNNYAHKDDVKTLSDGSTCHEDDFEDLQHELDEEEIEGMFIAESYKNSLTEKDQSNE